MAQKTGIAWTSATWNPTTGCTKVSAGCDHCYAEVQALKLQKMGSPKYADGFAVRTHAGALLIPFKWPDGRRIFVNSMSDLWHHEIPRDFLDRIFAVMALTPRHQYQCLTKRPQIAYKYLSDPQTPGRIVEAIAAMLLELSPHMLKQANDALRNGRVGYWPIANVWVGTSVENARETHRIDALRRTPAAIRFLSCEPLLGDLGALDLTGIHWVIVGGESGPEFRPMDLGWARSIRDQCQAQRVAFFYKQGAALRSGQAATLDGREWHEYPPVPADLPV